MGEKSLNTPTPKRTRKINSLTCPQSPLLPTLSQPPLPLMTHCLLPHQKSAHVRPSHSQHPTTGLQHPPPRRRPSPGHPTNPRPDTILGTDPLPYLSLTHQLGRQFPNLSPTLGRASWVHWLLLYSCHPATQAVSSLNTCFIAEPSVPTLTPASSTSCTHAPYSLNSLSRLRQATIRIYLQ
jgi:hypothetical protein